MLCFNCENTVFFTIVKSRPWWLPPYIVTIPSSEELRKAGRNTHPEEDKHLHLVLEVSNRKLTSYRRIIFSMVAVGSNTEHDELWQIEYTPILGRSTGNWYDYDGSHLELPGILELYPVWENKGDAWHTTFAVQLGEVTEYTVKPQFIGGLSRVGDDHLSWVNCLPSERIAQIDE